MAPLKEGGFTLIESLVATGILSMIVVGIMASFMVQSASNTRSEQRMEATAVAAQTMEFLRLDDPETMPDSGMIGPQLVNLNDREYEVYTSYCTKNNYCDDSSRHLLIQVFLDGREVYDVETVYTQLR